MKMNKTMNVAGREYPVIDMVEDENGNKSIPLLDIKMMDDETWNRHAAESNRRHMAEWGTVNFND